MTLQEALDYYGGSKSKLAEAIGRTPATVTNWIARGGVIPEASQYRLQRATKGRLKADIPESKTA